MTGTLSLFEHNGVVSLTLRCPHTGRDLARVHLAPEDLAVAMLRPGQEVTVSVQAWPTREFYAETDAATLNSK